MSIKPTPTGSERLHPSCARKLGSSVELPAILIGWARMWCNGWHLWAPALWRVLLPFAFSALGVRADSELFVDGAVWRIRLEIRSEDLRSLRNHPREYVHATLGDATNILTDIALRLKGSSSFRTVDDKPSFTVDCGRFKAGQRFHGLSKIHLNNSIEDPSYLNEKLGSELFCAEGVPTPRD